MDEEEGLSRFGCLESSAASSPAVTPRQRHILFEEEEEAGSPLMPPSQQQQQQQQQQHLQQQQRGGGEEDLQYEFELAPVKPGESFLFSPLFFFARGFFDKKVEGKKNTSLH